MIDLRLQSVQPDYKTKPDAYASGLIFGRTLSIFQQGYHLLQRLFQPELFRTPQR